MRLGGHAPNFVHPLLELKDYRIGFLLPFFLQCVAGDTELLCLVLYVIEFIDVRQRLT